MIFPGTAGQDEERIPFRQSSQAVTVPNNPSTNRTNPSSPMVELDGWISFHIRISAPAEHEADQKPDAQGDVFGQREMSREHGQEFHQHKRQRGDGAESGDDAEFRGDWLRLD